MQKSIIFLILPILLLCLIITELPAQALTGTKTIGSGGDYTTFTSAINALNSNGVGAGGVTFNVSAGATFTERPPAITASGTETDPIVFRKSGTGANPVITPTGTSAGNEAGIIISGGDYITFDGIDVNASAVTNIEYGFLIRNANATNGAKHNTLKDLTVTMNRGNSTSFYSCGILQSANASYGGGTNPTAQSGANDYNRYLNFTIQNSASGIIMYGGDYLDMYCEITTTANTTRNTLTNLGSTTGIFSYGIYIYKGSAFTISNCDITTLSSSGDNIIGINLIEYGLTSTVNNNKIRDLTNTGTSTAYRTIGMNFNHIYAGTGGLLVYNNTISDLKCASSGPTSTIKIIGASLGFYQSNESINLYNNTISIGYGRSWDFSSVGVSNNAESTDIMMIGNIVANYATNTGSLAKSYCISATRRYLGDGDTDYNLYYCKNGYTGSAEGWTAITITDWINLVQFGKETHSVYGDPYLIDPNTNLHGTGSKAIGQPGYTVPAFVTMDMDYDTRGIPAAIGADTYTPIDEDSNVSSPLVQVPGGNLSSVACTPQDALEVFRFRMSDSGGDGYDTKVTTVKIKSTYIYNFADWTSVFQGALLKVNGVTVSTATAVITNADITFTIPEGDLNIADGATVNCGLYIYFKTSGIIDGKTLKFMITQESHGFTNGFWGSRLPVVLSENVASSDFTIRVTATQLRLTYPRRELINRQFTLLAEGVDANGNFDPQFDQIQGTMSLQTGTGNLSGTMQQLFTQGDALWTISYNRYEAIKLQIVAGALSIITDYIEINPYIEVSSDPPAGFPTNTTLPFIYGSYFGRSVSLYTNTEVNGLYTIEALSWNCTTPTNAYPSLPVKVYIKPYSYTFNGLGSTTWESLVSGATQVFNGNVRMNSTGWQKITLDTPYTNNAYNQSLLVFIESNWGSAGSPTLPQFAGSYSVNQDYQYFNSGYSAPSSPIYMSKYSYRPYIRFWVISQGYYEDAVTEQSSTATINANSTDQQIIRVNVKTGGTQSQQTLNSLTFNTTGTTDPGDILAAKVYYTGSSTTFTTTTQYGSTVTNLGAKGTFTVSQNLSFPAGDHYFWLVYDIGANPGIGDHFDAQCTAVTVANVPRTPSVTDPAGYRSVAGKKLMSIDVTQLGQGTASSGAQNLGILNIGFYVDSGSDAQSFASLKLNSIAVTGKNTNNADVSAVKLSDQTNPSTFLATTGIATGIANLTNLNYELPLGYTNMYIYYDLSSGAGAGNIVDAKLLANSINVSGYTYPASEQDPSGQYTIQNYNYGGGYAEQGGYYFANTLATPAPSHPDFDWIDISATGTNAYPDMTNDDGYAPNNAVGYPIGFSFPYFGNSFSSFWIGADGSVYLSRPTLPLPMGQPPMNAIACFNADFMPTTANYPKTVLYKNVDGKLVITYLKVQPKNGANVNSFATFQLILFPTGKFKIQLLEFGSAFPTSIGSVYIVNGNASAFHMYAYGGQAGPVTGASPIAVAYGQNAYMLGEIPAENDLPVSVSGTGTVSFPITGATVQFTTSTSATQLTAIRVDTNPQGSLPVGILSLADRHWTINSTATSGLGSYNLTLDLTGLPHVGAANTFYLVKRSHVTSAWENLGLPVSFNEATMHATWNIVNGFSDFGIGFEEIYTLPVVLSAFNATLTANNLVKLNWTTQSETGLNGFYIYRAPAAQLSSALLVSPLIPGSNTSSQQSYQYIDQEIYEEGMYYYWLQVSDMDGSSSYHGPVSVQYSNDEEPPIPEIPLLTELRPVYPNPFNPQTCLSYTLKEASPVDIRVYNQRGQLVRKFTGLPTTQGLHRLIWDGKDSLGTPCSSGVYVITMTAGKKQYSQKAILLK